MAGTDKAPAVIAVFFKNFLLFIFILDLFSYSKV